jgi:hypothetical protein
MHSSIAESIGYRATPVGEILKKPSSAAHNPKSTNEDRELTQPPEVDAAIKTGKRRSSH